MFVIEKVEDTDNKGKIKSCDDPREMKTYVYIKAYKFIVALFTVTEKQEQLKCPKTGERIRCGVSIQWNITP